jgi:hypothetical protein
MANVPVPGPHEWQSDWSAPASRTNGEISKIYVLRNLRIYFVIFVQAGCAGERAARNFGMTIKVFFWPDQGLLIHLFALPRPREPRFEEWPGLLPRLKAWHFVVFAFGWNVFCGLEIFGMGAADRVLP